MLQPYKGQVFDPCCGSGGMFVHSEKFVLAHQGKIDDISIFGQESDLTTWRLAKMNLAIRGIDSSNVKWNNQGSFLKDEFRDSKFDFIIANPPFNDSDWSGDLLQKDGRWQYGLPPAANANFAWIQHFLYHLKPTGTAGIVLSKGSLSVRTNNEGEIRKALVDAKLVDCIVNLPTKLFLNTQIPACLWFLSRSKNNGKYRNRENEVLFIDARNLGHLVTRKNRMLSDGDIHLISDTYHSWREKDGKFEDVQGFCKSATIDDIKKLGYVLTPGRYIGLPDDEDDFDFEDRAKKLKEEINQQMIAEVRLNEIIQNNLEKIIIPKSKSVNE